MESLKGVFTRTCTREGEISHTHRGMNQDALGLEYRGKKAQKVCFIQGTKVCQG